MLVVYCLNIWLQNICRTSKSYIFKYKKLLIYLKKYIKKVEK